MEGMLVNNDLKIRITNEKEIFLQSGIDYVAAGNGGMLYSIKPIDTTIEDNPVAIGSFVKTELVHLYEYYFRNDKKPARFLYEKLLNSAGDDCPFCGGIGTPRNLDHFLPKAHFPQYSIFPQNLVPSCRDCNMDGKAQSFATEPSSQIIQPYVDHDRFFQDQWVYASCLIGTSNSPEAVSYFVNAPATWDEVDRKRAQRHFDDFDLGKRYAVEASAQLKIIVDQILNLQKIGIGNATICTTLLTPGVRNAPFINHWIRGMYQALADHLA